MIDSNKGTVGNDFLNFIFTGKLLDDEALFGKSRTNYETLISYAYTTLSDLIHHVRNKLTLLQIQQTVFFTRILFDPTLSLTIQTMSAKLLVHLVESIFKFNGDKKPRREILIKIMKSFISKVKSLSYYIKGLQQLYY
jgi:transformation/transcription domain-associated protein